MPVAMRHAFPKDERRDDDQEVVDYFTYEVTRIKRKEIDSPLRKKEIRLRSGADARRNEYTGRNENLNENEYERIRKKENNKHTYIPKRVNFKDT